MANAFIVTRKRIVPHVHERPTNVRHAISIIIQKILDVITVILSTAKTVIQVMERVQDASLINSICLILSVMIAEPKISV